MNVKSNTSTIEDCYRRLACGVILQCLRDIHENNGRSDEAEQWLLCSPQAKMYLDCLDLSEYPIEKIIIFVKRSTKRLALANYVNKSP